MPRNNIMFTESVNPVYDLPANTLQVTLGFNKGYFYIWDKDGKIIGLDYDEELDELHSQLRKKVAKFIKKERQRKISRDG